MRSAVVVVVVVVVLLAMGGCRSVTRTVTRTPVSFATESDHARDNEEYRFAGWVSGESREEGCFAPFAGLASGDPVWVRTFSGNAEVPRTVASASKKALKPRPNAVFLANVSVESELRQGCLEPVRICTIVTGAAMEPSEMSSRAAAPSTTPPTPPRLPPLPPLPPTPAQMTDDDDAPSRVTPK